MKLSLLNSCDSCASFSEAGYRQPEGSGDDVGVDPTSGDWDWDDPFPVSGSLASSDCSSSSLLEGTSVILGALGHRWLSGRVFSLAFISLSRSSSRRIFCLGSSDLGRIIGSLFFCQWINEILRYSSLINLIHSNRNTVSWGSVFSTVFMSFGGASDCFRATTFIGSVDSGFLITGAFIDKQPTSSHLIPSQSRKA